MPDPVTWTFSAGAEYSEELAWLTDVLQAPTGGTQHRRLRQSPRTTIGFSALESGSNRRWLDAQLRANSAGRWWVPVAIDAVDLASAVTAGATVLPATIGSARFVVGGKLLVIGADPRIFEVGTISAVGSGSVTLSAGLAMGWPAGAQLIPLRAGRLLDVPSVGRYTADDSALVPLRFVLDDPLDTAASLPGSTYRSFQVFDAFVPAWTADPTWSPERSVALLEDEIAAPMQVDLSGVALGKTVMQYAADTAAAVVSLRAALFALAGRWAPVWVPSWAHDLRLVAGVSAGQSFIDVEGPLLSLAALPANHRDIRIMLAGGAVHYRRINSASAVSSTVDRLVLDSALPSAFALAEVAMVCFMALSVQDSDTNSLRYLDVSMMQCELSWRELDHEF